MRGALYFVCLLFLLLRGLDSTSVPHSKTSYTAANFFGQGQQENSSGLKDNYSYVRDARLLNHDHPAVEDYEDEKNNHSFVFRQPLLIRREIILPEAFHFNYQYGCATDQLTYFGHLPDIYITQRALRI